MGVAVPAGDKFVMGICLVEIFRVRKTGPVESNLVKRAGVAYAFFHQRRLCPLARNSAAALGFAHGATLCLRLPLLLTGVRQQSICYIAKNKSLQGGVLRVQ